jgi:GT2 family glycosyltransferase
LPSVAVVILNWNGKSYLEKFLPYVVAATYQNLQIFVADNASNDDSVSFLKKNYPAIKIILNDTNDGFAKGYNSALSKIPADYYVLLNSDVEVTKNWIEPVILLMESDDKIAACQPKLLSFENRQQFEYAGASGGFIDKLCYPFTRGRIFETCEFDHGQYDNSIQIFWATGAALFVRSKVFHELNGFDEYFFAHQEEIDLCWRMQRAGHTIYVMPSSVVYHVGGGTLPVGNRRKVFLNFRNNLIMMSKNLSFTEACLRIPVRIFLDFIAAYRALFAGDFATYTSIASAHIHYVKWCFFHKKIKKLPKIKTNKLITVYDRSIVWQYFIKNRKTFLEINPFKK